MGSKKRINENIIIVAIAIILIFLLFVLINSSDDKVNEERKTLSRRKRELEKQKSEKSRLKKLTDGEISYNNNLKNRINKKARIGTAIIMSFILASFLFGLVLLVYYLSNGSPVLTIITSTVSLIVLSKILWETIPIVIGIKTISLQGIRDYFYEKSLKTLYKKYNYSTSKHQELMAQSSSLEEELRLIDEEIEMINNKLKELGS